jgi:hypothetical protein
MPSKPSPSDIVDRIASSIRVTSTAAYPWWKRVTPEQAKVLETIRTAWREGKFGPLVRPAARAVAAMLSELGIADISETGVKRWYDRTL